MAGLSLVQAGAAQPQSPGSQGQGGVVAKLLFLGLCDGPRLLAAVLLCDPLSGALVPEVMDGAEKDLSLGGLAKSHSLPCWVLPECFPILYKMPSVTFCEDLPFPKHHLHLS